MSPEVALPGKELGIPNADAKRLRGEVLGAKGVA